MLPHFRLELSNISLSHAESCLRGTKSCSLSCSGLWRNDLVVLFFVVLTLRVVRLLLFLVVLASHVHGRAFQVLRLSSFRNLSLVLRFIVLAKELDLVVFHHVFDLLLDLLVLHGLVNILLELTSNVLHHLISELRLNLREDLEERPLGDVSLNLQGNLLVLLPLAPRTHPLFFLLERHLLVGSALVSGDVLVQHVVIELLGVLVSKLVVDLSAMRLNNVALSRFKGVVQRVLSPVDLVGELLLVLKGSLFLLNQSSRGRTVLLVLRPSREGVNAVHDHLPACLSELLVRHHFLEQSIELVLQSRSFHCRLMVVELVSLFPRGGGAISHSSVSRASDSDLLHLHISDLLLPLPSLLPAFPSPLDLHSPLEVIFQLLLLSLRLLLLPQDPLQLLLLRLQLLHVHGLQLLLGREAGLLVEGLLRVLLLRVGVVVVGDRELDWLVGGRRGICGVLGGVRLEVVLLVLRRLLLLVFGNNLSSLLGRLVNLNGGFLGLFHTLVIGVFGGTGRSLLNLHFQRSLALLLQRTTMSDLGRHLQARVHSHGLLLHLHGLARAHLDHFLW